MMSFIAPDSFLILAPMMYLAAQHSDVLVAHQAGISNDHEVVPEPIPLYEVVHDGNHRVFLELHPVKHSIRQRIVATAYEQAKHNLPVRVLPVLRESIVVQGRPCP